MVAAGLVGTANGCAGIVCAFVRRIVCVAALVI